MCGITGALSFYFPPSLEIITSMTTQLAHRGPDDQQFYQDQTIALGHRRLSIIDPQLGQQPMQSADGRFICILNGEIYNFKELKSILTHKGCTFTTHSDTEVLLSAFQVFGKDCLHYLNGMFAFAIWDKKEQELFIARDRMGQKPLYYIKTPQSFVFASEIKALLKHPEVEKQINPNGLIKYLSLEYIPAPHTIYKGIKKLLPAHYLSIKENQFNIQPYWTFPTPMGQTNYSLETAKQELHDLMKQSVKQRLVSDVPLGLFVSGGLDSSIISLLASEERKDLTSFGIGFEDASFDESTYIHSISQHLGTDHFHQMVKAQDLLNIVDQIPIILDEPMADPSIIPTTIVSKLASKQVKVVLGGDGSDELFAGYPTYLAHRLALDSTLSLEPVQYFLDKWQPSDKNISLDFKVKRFIKGLKYSNPLRHIIWMATDSPENIQALFKPDYLELISKEHIYQEIIDYFNRCQGKTIEKILYLDSHTYLQDDILTKVDRASMYASLEARSPFLDPHLVSWVARLPLKFKLHFFNHKYLLKETFKAHLPPEIVQRSKKGFGVPISSWFKHELKDRLRKSLSDLPDCFQKEVIQRYFDEHITGKKNHRKLLWSLFVLSLWNSEYQPSL